MSWYKKSQNRKEIPPVTILMYDKTGQLKVDGMPQQYYYGVTPPIYRQLSNLEKFHTSWAYGRMRSILTNVKNNWEKQNDPQMKLF